MSETTKHNIRTATAFIVYDLFPAILAISVLIFITMKIPILLVGMVLGYLGCKYHAKLIELKELYIKKISEMKTKYEDNL